MSTSRGTWPRRSPSSSALALLALIPLAAGAAQAGSRQNALAFDRAQGYDFAVWIAKADGSDARKLVETALRPKFSPDGRRVAYVVPRRPSALPMLWVKTLATGRTTRIDAASEVAWGPQSRRLVYLTRQRILLADAESGRRRLLDRGHVCCASFSPGGDSVVYAKSNGSYGRGFRSDAYAIRLTDGHVSRLTHDHHSGRPVWGRGWIAYSHYRARGGWLISDLRLMRPDGSRKRILASGHDKPSSAHGIEPVAFSQDGTHLLACLPRESDCAPVTFALLDGKPHVLQVRRRSWELAFAIAISRDGRYVLAQAGGLKTPQRVVVVPFAGGTARVLARNAEEPTWTR
jgi:dipeptidyl aminopeptidase/acylaminoacyl peptidase